MELVIYTYGHIDAMYYVLNAIAMLMQKLGEPLIRSMAVISAAYYGLKMAYSGSSGQYKQYLVKLAGMVLMISIALVPTTSMIIIDHVSKKKEKVDNLPYGFAVPVGIIEQFGNILASGFEQAFNRVGSINYQDYGMVFGARLVQDSRNWRIKSPEFSENMQNFLSRCVVREAMMGYRYTPQDLLTRDNIWGLIKENLSTLRRVEMRKGKARDLVSCTEAANNHITPAFTMEVASLQKQKSGSDYANATSNSNLTPRSNEALNNMLQKNIELSFRSYLGSNKSAEDLIKQQMLINSLGDIADDYGYARASMQQESNWRIASDLASTYLPILLTVIKGLLYSSFIFLIPLMLLSGGGAKYLSYLTVVTSLQLWPALNSVLNMFIDLYSSNTLTGIADGIVSFATYSEVGNYADKIVAVASGLQMSVPFLAFAIVQGGVGGFIHLAGNITGASQSAATSVASEVATGNRSLDNVSMGNMQYAMQNGFKNDWNQSYAADSSMYQHMNGSMEKVLGSGNAIYQSGAGMTISGGNIKVNARDDITDQLTEGFSNTQSLMDSDQRAYNNSSQLVYDKTASMVASLAKSASSGQTIHYDEAGEDGKSMQLAVNQARMLHDTKGYGWNQAADMALRGSISFSTPLKGLTGVGLSGSVDGSISSSNNSNQGFSDDNQISSHKDTRLDYSSVVRAARNEEFAKANNVNDTYSQDIRKSYHQQQALEGQIAKRAEQLKSYSNAISQSKSRGVSFDEDIYHKLEHSVADTYNISTKEANDWLQAGDARTIPVRQKIISDEVSKLIPHQIDAGRAEISAVNANRGLNEFSAGHQNKIHQDYVSDIRQEAIKRGIDPNDSSFVEDNVSYRANTLINDNKDRFSRERENNELRERIAGENIKTLENNRIGQGITSKIISGGTGIGGPTGTEVKSSNTLVGIGTMEEEPMQRGIQIVQNKKD